MRSRKFMNFILGAPSFVWLVIFYALPVLIVFLLAFKPVDSYGGIGSGWTMKTIQDLGNPSYPAIIGAPCGSAWFPPRSALRLQFRSATSFPA